MRRAMLAVWLCWGALWMPWARADVPAVEAFARSSPFSLPRLSPDGEHLAVNAEYDDGNYALVVYHLPDMQVSAMLRFPRYELAYQIAWVSDDRLVVAKARKTGSLDEPQPNGEIVAVDADGSDQAYIYGYTQAGRISGLARGFGYIAGLPRTPNGRFYMRQLSLETRHSMLYDVDARAGTGRLLADIATPDLGFVLDADGHPRYAYGSDDNDNNLLFSIDAKGLWQPMPDVQDYWRPIAFSPDNQQVYAYYSKAGGPSSLVLGTPRGDEHSVLAGDAFFSTQDVQWRNMPEATPFAVELGDGKPAPVYLGEGTEIDLYKALRQSLPDRALDFVDYSRDGKRVLLRLYSDRDAGGWYLFDRDRNKLERLLLSRPDLRPAMFGERRMVRFKARDGMELGAVVTFPAGAESGTPLPMVLLPHGGPHASGDGWAFDTDAQFLASRGYLVLQVNYRGSQGRGRRFEAAGYRQWGRAIQDDLVDGVRWAVQQHLADPQRVCAYGASFGAYSALMVAAREPGMFRCAAGMAGIYDLRMMYSKGDIRQSEFGRNYLQRAIGNDPAELAANSPVTLAAKIRVPVLLVHGEKDERAPLAQATAMRAALVQAGNAPDWMSVPKEGHGFYKEENNVAFYRRLEAFLARNLARPASAASP